jgi:hypothetical protein
MVELVAAYGLAAKLLPAPEGFRVLAFGLALGLFFTVNEIVLPAKVLLPDGEIHVRRCGYLQSRICLPIGQVATVIVTREYDPVLRIQLIDGQLLQFGPWTRWNTRKRFRQLIRVKAQIERHVLRANVPASMA